MASLAKEEGLGIDGGHEHPRRDLPGPCVLARSSSASARSSRPPPAELRAANERLRELDRMKDDFVSTVSHELRTPLTSIRAFAEILHDSPELAAAEAPGVRRHHPARDRAADPADQPDPRPRQDRIRPRGMGGGAARPARGDPRCRRLDGRAVPPSASVQLETQVPDRVPIVVADRDRLQQVLLNLLANAVKFCTPGAGRVRVALSARRRRGARRRRRQRHRDRAASTRARSSRSSGRSATRSPTGPRAPASACRSRG